MAGFWHPWVLGWSLISLEDLDKHSTGWKLQILKNFNDKLSPTVHRKICVNNYWIVTWAPKIIHLATTQYYMVIISNFIRLASWSVRPGYFYHQHAIQGCKAKIHYLIIEIIKQVMNEFVHFKLQVICYIMSSTNSWKTFWIINFSAQFSYTYRQTMLCTVTMQWFEILLMLVPRSVHT